MSYRKTAFKSMFFIILVICIVGLGIAYAVLSTTLTINGSTSVSAASWNIHFANINGSSTGDATFTIPTLDVTSLTDYQIVLTKPSDSVTFTFDIVNDGTIDAKITSFIKNVPLCSGVGGSSTGEADSALVCNNITYTMTYVSDGSIVGIGDTLNRGETKSIKLTLSYGSGGSQVPTNDVAISNLDITMIYSQV